MDTQLKKAFEETLEARIISTVPDMPDHRFSPQFERKMKRLAGGGAPKKLTVRRFFICVTAALIAAALAASSVSAVRDFFKRFFSIRCRCFSFVVKKHECCPYHLWI